MTELRSVAVTTGEPAGIGPEVSLKAAAAVSDPILLIGDRTLLEAEARRLGIAWPLPAHVSIRHVQLRAPAEPGRLDTRNSAYVLDIAQLMKAPPQANGAPSSRRPFRKASSSSPVCPSQATPSSSRISAASGASS